MRYLTVLVLFLTACGKPGAQGPQGQPGTPGQPGGACTVERFTIDNPKNGSFQSGALFLCPDGSSVFIPDPKPVTDDHR